MILDAIFDTEKTYPVVFSTTSSTEVDGQIVGDPVDTPILATRCICYRGNIGQSYKSEQFRADVTATIILRPKDYTVKIPEGTKATVDGIGTYSVIFADDVAGAGLAIILPCREYRNE